MMHDVLEHHSNSPNCAFRDSTCNAKPIAVVLGQHNFLLCSQRVVTFSRRGRHQRIQSFQPASTTSAIQW